MVTIYYADLTPCDDMHNYAPASFVPDFVKKDTPQFDTEPPVGVIQVATTFGWCIVAKWCNNGSTRIYAKSEDAVEAGCSILHGRCDSGDCDFAYGEHTIRFMEVSDEDSKVFFGRDVFDDMFENAMAQGKPSPNHPSYQLDDNTKALLKKAVIECCKAADCDFISRIFETAFWQWADHITDEFYIPSARDIRQCLIDLGMEAMKALIEHLEQGEWDCNNPEPISLESGRLFFKISWYNSEEGTFLHPVDDAQMTCGIHDEAACIDMEEFKSEEIQEVGSKK